MDRQPFLGCAKDNREGRLSRAHVRQKRSYEPFNNGHCYQTYDGARVRNPLPGYVFPLCFRRAHVSAKVPLVNLRQTADAEDNPRRT